MRNKLLKLLQNKRQSEIQIASKKLLAGEQHDVSGEIKRIEDCDKLIAALPQPRHIRLPLAALVAFVAVTVVALAWTIRIPSTKILLSVQGSALELELDKTLEWTGDLPIDPNPMRFEWLTQIHLRPFPPVFDSFEGNHWVQIDGGKVTLSRIELKKAGRFSIETRDGEYLDVYSHRAPLSGELLLRGQSNVSMGVDSADKTPALTKSLDLVIPETLVFKADRPATVAIRAHLGFRPLDDLVLNNLIVRYLSFSREISVSPGETKFVSSLKGGTLEFPEVSTRLELRKGDQLSLQDLRGRIRELKVVDEIYVEFEGTANTISLGPLGFERDLTPSLLEYIYHNERLLLFWSGLIFAWGLLWNVRVFLAS